MTVYHGSYAEVSVPDLEHSRSNVDFGVGFYTTPIFEQAEKWSRKFYVRRGSAVISCYDFDENAANSLKILRFDGYTEAWLDFILSCRGGRDDTDYDLVAGGVANDKVFNTVELYFDGLIDKYEAIKRLKYEKPNLQIAFRTQKALKTLKFTGSKLL